MSRLENVIEETKQVQIGKNRAWIFDEEGNIRDDVIVADSLAFLENLKPYEINVTDEWITEFKKDAENYYSYNYNTNASHALSIWYKEKLPIAIICLHLKGDACSGYFSDYFAIKMEERFYENILITLISWYESDGESIEITDKLSADVSLFSETYDVYDYEKQEDVGTYYEIEKSELLKAIEKEKQI